MRRRRRSGRRVGPVELLTDEDGSSGAMRENTFPSDKKQSRNSSREKFGARFPSCSVCDSVIPQSLREKMIILRFSFKYHEKQIGKIILTSVTSGAEELYLETLHHPTPDDILGGKQV